MIHVPLISSAKGYHLGTVVKKQIIGWDLENYVYYTIRKKYPAWKGWTILEQPTIKHGWRPDFLVKKRVPFAVIDAKDRDALVSRDVDRILDYKEAVKAKEAVIYVAHDT